MRRRLRHRSALLDLIAFVTVLATGVTLVALGLSPEALVVVTVALTGLYSAWRKGRSADDPDTGVDVRQEAPGPGESAEVKVEHVTGR